MLSASWLKTIQYTLLYLLAFVIPLPYVYVNAVLITLSFVWILQVNFKELGTNFYRNKILWAYVAYFGLFALSYFYSDNKTQSAFDTGSKTFLLVMPIVIGAGTDISKRQLERVFFAFICGVTLITFISVGNAFLRWKQTGDVNSLFYHNLVQNLDANAVYEALYTFFSLSLLLLFKWESFFNGKKRYLKYLIITIQVAFFMLLSARMLMLLLVIFLIPYYIIHTFRTDINRKKIIITLGTLLILLTTVVVTENPIKERFKDFFVKSSELAFIDDYSHVKEADFNTFTLRLFLWRIGIENVYQKKLWLTGAGNGDAQAMQNNKMKEYGINNIHEELALRSPLYNANLHNMYLQSLIMVGIFGLILLLIITLRPFFLYRNSTYAGIFLPFHVSTVFFMIQESMFQTQAGLAFYTFFSIIYYNLYFKSKNVEK